MEPAAVVVVVVEELVLHHLHCVIFQRIVPPVGRVISQTGYRLTPDYVNYSCGVQTQLKTRSVLYCDKDNVQKSEL